MPKERRNQEEIVFMRNDPSVIKSEYAYSDSLRKPDVVATFVPYMQKRFGVLKDYDFEKMIDCIADGSITTTKVDLVDQGDGVGKIARVIGKKLTGRRKTVTAKSTGKTPEAEPEPLQWIDVQQTWELKRTPDVRLKPCTDTVWNAEKLGEVTSDSDLPSKVKVEKGRDGTDRTAKSKNDSRSEPLPYASGLCTVGAQVTNEPKKDPESQCAYYAIERLSAAWYMTHSIVVMVDGE